MDGGASNTRPCRLSFQHPRLEAPWSPPTEKAGDSQKVSITIFVFVENASMYVCLKYRGHPLTRNEHRKHVSPRRKQSRQHPPHVLYVWVEHACMQVTTRFQDVVNPAIQRVRKFVSRAAHKSSVQHTAVAGNLPSPATCQQQYDNDRGHHASRRVSPFHSNPKCLQCNSYVLHSSTCFDARHTQR